MPPQETMNQEIRQYDKIIIGIDPGTRVMGYGLLGITGKTPALIAMGVIKLSLLDDHYMRLRRIYERVAGLVDEYLPDEMAIEAPFYGKNVQSMLKLGRAQGVAMAAALRHDVPITEYEPRKIKQAITGNGAASKEQVATMIQHTLKLTPEQMPEFLDATDALAAALCHHYEGQKPAFARGQSSWKAFIAQHPERVKGAGK